MGTEDDFDWARWISFQSPLVTITGQQDGNRIRQILLANMLRTRFCNSNSAEDREFFAQELGPGVPVYLLEKPFNPAKREGVSTCGLWVEHQYSHGGCEVPAYYQPYYPLAGGKRYSITRTIVQAEKWGSWEKAKPAPIQGHHPKPVAASMVVVGTRRSGESYGGTEHAFGILRHLGDNEYETIESGTVDPKTGLQRVEIRTRFLEHRLSSRGVYELWMPRTRGGAGRRVLGWVWPDLCMYSWKAEAPSGWEKLPLIDP